MHRRWQLQTCLVGLLLLSLRSQIPGGDEGKEERTEIRDKSFEAEHSDGKVCYLQGLSLLRHGGKDPMCDTVPNFTCKVEHRDELGNVTDAPFT